MTKIPTSRGEVTIQAPSPFLLRNLRALLPFGACQLSNPGEDNTYAIAMQCDEKEVYCIKQQPLECDRENAERWMDIQHWMCVDALSRYRKDGFSGAYLPTQYIRQRDNELWEAGVAHFIFPSPSGIEAQEFPYDGAFDKQFGHGATTMFMSFVGHFKAAFAESPITMPQYLGLDVRPRLHLQSLAMNFLCFGPHVLCVRKKLLAKEDPAWTILAGAGVKTVHHMPCVPMAIKGTDLAITKFAPPSE